MKFDDSLVAYTPSAPCKTLGLFLISNLTVFGAIVNGFDSLISLSSVSSLVYRNATDVCALIFLSCHFDEFLYEF